MGFGHAVARSGRDFINAAGIVLALPAGNQNTPNAAQFAKEKLAEMGEMSRGERIMLTIFAVLLLLWAGVPAMIFGSAWAVDPTTTALLGLVLLLLTGVLTWDDVLKEKARGTPSFGSVRWIMMASYLNKLGLIAWFSQSLQSGITHWAGLVCRQRLAAARVYVCALLLCQHHGAHHSDVRCLFRCRYCLWARRRCYSPC